MTSRRFGGWILIATLLACASGCAREASAPVVETSAPTVAVSDHPAPTDTFHFAILGDNAGGTRPGVYASALARVARMRPDFVISVGDLTSGWDADGALDEPAKIEAQRGAFDAEIAEIGVPYYYVSGNNDNATRELHDDWRARYGPTYYSFVHRDVLFVVLDSDDPPGTGNAGISEEQLTWLEGVLDENSEAVWTLVFLHRPVWLEQAEVWRPVEAALGDRRRTVFAGHWHTFFRSRVNDHDYYLLATTGGISALSGPLEGSFDHVVWVAMTPQGPQLTNLQLAGIWGEDPVAESVPGGELTTRIRREGIDLARDLLASGGLDPEAPGFGEAQMFSLGRELAYADRIDDAAEVLKLLLVAYPDSWRGQQALGDVYRQRGEVAKARQHYQRLLELRPGNSYAQEQLEVLAD